MCDFIHTFGPRIGLQRQDAQRLLATGAPEPI